jgi:hypothetical protein
MPKNFDAKYEHAVDYYQICTSYLFIYGIFNNVLSSSCYKVLNNMVIGESCTVSFVCAGISGPNQ